jgi:DNA-binding protein HU-beta
MWNDVGHVRTGVCRRAGADDGPRGEGKIVNKREMVERIVERTDYPLTVVAEIVDSFIDETSAAVIGGDRVTLSGFGTFYRQARAQRTARNIWTGESVTVRARELPAFRPGKPFRDEVARRRRKPAAKKKSTRRG